MTGFDIFDRYDFAGLLLLDVVLAIALLVGVPLWVAGVAILIACVAVFVRHFDETMGP
jgi:hypothetical protein